MTKATKPDSIQQEFTRAVLDRNLACDPAPFRKAIDNLDLRGLAVFDFGCGTGFLEYLLKNTDADVIYAFEVFEDEIDEDIRKWAADPSAKPRLVINPDEYMIDRNGTRGDFTNYDYFRILEQHDAFATISNPPYFLYNRILSLTGQSLAPEDSAYKTLGKKFEGALMLTSASRLTNHPEWDILARVPGTAFSPPAGNEQYLLRTGFSGRIKNDATLGKTPKTKTQRYPGINNRNPVADPADCYPDMWDQIDTHGKPGPRPQ